ncbi:MAG: CPBP family intramembrane metalloprotease [Bacillota bacterium]|nr:CPBP family intramembrane metalloprotease [Bacillota bacterium]
MKQAPSPPRRLLRHGPAFTIVASILLVLALGAGGVILALVNPSQTGVLGQEYAATQTFAFGQLTLTTEYLTLDIQAGVLVPAMSHGEVSGVLVFGLGWADLVLPPDLADELARTLGALEFKEDFEAMYIPASYQTLERLKRLCGATLVDEPEYVRIAQDILDAHIQDPGLLRAFRRPPAAAPPGSPNAVRVYSVTYGRVDYLEGPRILLDLSQPVPRKLSFPHPGGTGPAFPRLYAEPVPLVTVILYGVLGALLWLLIFALTLHLREPAWVTRAARTRGGLPLGSNLLPDVPYLGAVPAAALLLVPALARPAGVALFGKAYPLYAFDVAAAASLAVWAWRRRVPAEHLGLTRRGLPLSLFGGLLVGFYIVVAASVGYPSGVRPLPGWAYALAAARSLLLVAPSRELLLRGVVQTSLERYLGRGWAVVVPSVVTGLSYLAAATLAYGPSGQVGPLLLESLLVVPVSSILAGYLYLRTRNLAAPALATGVADLLPRVLSF